jgi:hypothetical protein
MEPIYKERGGGWVDYKKAIMLQLTWPFVIIYIYEDKVVINYGGKEFNLKYNEIEEVRLSYWIPFIAEGIRLVHNNPERPHLLRFWSLGHSKKLKQLIQSKMSASVL